MDTKSLMATVAALAVLAAVAQTAKQPDSAERSLRAEPMWYLLSPSAPPQAAWFAADDAGLELHVLEQGRQRTSRITLAGQGFVEQRPEGAPTEWTLDGLAWRSKTGMQLVPAWVIPVGRGPGH